MIKTLSWRTIIIMAIVSLLGIAVFGIVPLTYPMLLQPDHNIHAAFAMYSMYMGIRNLLLAVFIAAALIARDRRGLGWMLLLNGCIQTADIIVGINHHNPGEIFGPLFFVILCLWPAFSLLGHNNKITG